MEEDLDRPLDPRYPSSPPRRFVYRSVDPDTTLPHPLRRSTDIPRASQGTTGQIYPRPVLLKFRVDLKVN